MKERETNFEEIWKLYCEYHNISNERQIVGNMTPEELSEIMRLANADRPQVNQTFNFNAPIGQQIAHVDKIEAHFDKNMGMQIAHAEVVSTPSDIAIPQEVSPSTPICLNSISYIRKGFALDDDRLKELGGGGYWKELLLLRIRDIRWECLPYRNHLRFAPMVTVTHSSGFQPQRLCLEGSICWMRTLFWLEASTLSSLLAKPQVASNLQEL